MGFKVPVPNDFKSDFSRSWCTLFTRCLRLFHSILEDHPPDKVHGVFLLDLLFPLTL